MNDQKNINIITFLLSAVAGFCDTATFVSGDSIFSAHVTGNFIVFAAQLVLHSGDASWVKLLTFPVFVIAVIVGGWIDSKWRNRYLILLIESVLLLVCGIVAVLYSSLFQNSTTGLYCIVMGVVAAMGLQNAFGKLHAKETYGPTTMMTGNVTQASLDLGNLLYTHSDSIADLTKQVFTIGGFLMGCLTGALISKLIGLTSVLIPAFTLMICYSRMLAKAQNNLYQPENTK